MAGPIAAALMAKSSELLSEPPQIEQVDVLGAKIPIVLTSRADNVRMRIGSAAVAKLVVHARRIPPAALP